MWTAAIGIALVIQRVDFQRMHLEMFNWTELDRSVLCAQNYTTSIGKLHYFQIDRYPFYLALSWLNSDPPSNEIGFSSI